ncbi:MAG: DUF3800 domain-containing protein [Sedimentisphaerales bacterium]|nr:DUF3800 domain-containing protein [Sedimentisphaerales bacterium]
MSKDSPSRYYILSGLIVHELRWRDCLTRLYEFKKRMANAFGLRVREEIHAARMISRTTEKLRHISKPVRLTILRHFIDEIENLPEARVINVLVDKQGKAADFDVFSAAWQRLIQRFENTISYRNFPGPKNADERGMIFPDNGQTKQLRQLVRQMRYYNYVPSNIHPGASRNLKLQYVIEDPNHRDSQDSYFIQAVDTVAFFLLQKHKPASYIKNKGANNYFDRLDNVLCRKATRDDPQGIVRV